MQTKVNGLWRCFLRRINPFRTGLMVAGAVFVPISFSGSDLQAQYSLTGSSYSQSFDDLGTGSLSAVTNRHLGNFNSNLNGWYFFESGTNANNNITAGAGGGSGGDTYNFGVASGTDRTLGGLQSGSLIPSWGFWFTNNTGREIRALDISYTGQTWRIGGTNRSDRIDFGYSSTATSLDAGVWTDFDALDYANPAAAATGSGSVLHTANISSSITALSIASGASFFIRWTDFNATGSDDGMGVNNFSLTAQLAAAPGYWDANGATGGVGGSGTWQTSSAAFSSSLAGTDPATRGASDPVIFAGTAGVVTVSGTVSVNSGMNFGTTGYSVAGGTINLGGATILDNALSIDSGGTATISSVITGSTGLSKTGTGTLELSGTNTFSGGVSLGGGELIVSSLGNLGDAANDISFSGGRLVVAQTLSTGSGADYSGSGAVQVSAGKALTVDGSFNMTATTLGGAGSLNLNGATRNVGALSFDGNATLNGSGLVSASSLTAAALTGGTAKVNADLSFTTGDKTTVVGSGGTLELNGQITATGRIIKQGAGTLVINGVNNSGGLRIGTSGATSVDGGNVVISSASALGTGALQHNFGTLSSTVNLTGANAINLGLSVGGRVNNGALAVIGGTSDIEFLGDSSFFRAGSTSGLLALNVNNNTSLGNFTVTTGSGTATGIRFGGSGVLTIKGNASALTENITVGDTLDLVIATTGTIGSGAGAFTVGNGASLINNGSISASLVTVELGGSYSGIGDLNAGIVIADGGQLAPGNSVGTATVNGSLDLNGTYNWELDTADAGIADVVIVDAGANGDITLGATSVLNIVSSNFNVGDEYTLFAYSGDLTGTFSSILLNGGSLGTYQVNLNYLATLPGLNDPGVTGFRYVTASITAVPEPGAVAILGGGLLTALSLRRRRDN